MMPELSPERRRVSPVAIVFIFAATVVFSASFILPYGSDIFAFWGIVIGATAAVSWFGFIAFLSKVGRVSLAESLRVCVGIMVPGNITLLGCVILNVIAWLGGWRPWFVWHIGIITVANLVMFRMLVRLTAGLFGAGKAALLWFGLMNGFFACLLVLAYRLWQP